MSVIAIPQILTERLTDEGARAFVEIIDKVEDHTQKATLEMAEERFETRLAQVGADLRNEIAQLRSEMRIENAQTQTRIIRWVVSMAWTQMAVIIAVMAIFFK